MEIEERIRAVREMRGWSQGDLARKLDVAPTTIASWETGRRQIKSRDLVRACEALGVKTEHLFSDGLWVDLQDQLDKADQMKRAALEEAKRLLLSDSAVSTSPEGTDSTRARRARPDESAHLGQLNPYYSREFARATA